MAVTAMVALPSIELLKAIQISNCSQQHTHRAEDLILAFDPKIEKGNVSIHIDLGDQCLA